MFEWLNNLKVGDEVIVRDSSHLITAEGPTDSVEVVSEITDAHIKTLPLGYEPKPAPAIEPWRLFSRRFGSSNSVRLIQLSA